MFRALIALCAALTLTACAKPTASIAPEGRLTVVDMAIEPLTTEFLQKNWVAQGVAMERLLAPDISALSFPRTPMGKSLKIRRYQADYLVARKTSARVVASPFFKWTWRVTKGEKHLPPFGIVIGFRGGRAEEREWEDSFMTWARNSDLKFDRSITLVPRVGFEATRLEKIGADNAIISYGAGLLGGGRWRTQVLDLQALYSQAWPADKIAQSSVVFAGFSVKGGRSADAVFIHQMALSR